MQGCCHYSTNCVTRLVNVHEAAGKKNIVCQSILTI